MKHFLLLMALLAGSALAQPPAEPAGERAQGEVRRVDKANAKITLKHGEIKGLDMPPMTMVFQVRDPKVLDQVKAGDTVHFRAEKVDGGYVVTELQPAR
ncbi:MAG TPA: copper-binding protein [Ramlibacter sp.]|nr:copper-binding protein [Ramlibacter sp.]